MSFPVMMKTMGCSLNCILEGVALRTAGSKDLLAHHDELQVPSKEWKHWFKTYFCQAWWLMPIITSSRRPRQEDHPKF